MQNIFPHLWRKNQISLIREWLHSWPWFLSHLIQPPLLSHPLENDPVHVTWWVITCSSASGRLCRFVAFGCAPNRHGMITQPQQASVYFLWKHGEVGVSGMWTSVRARTSKANMLHILPPTYLQTGAGVFLCPLTKQQISPELLLAAAICGRLSARGIRPSGAPRFLNALKWGLRRS